MSRVRCLSGPKGKVPPAPEPTGTPRPLSDDELAEVLDTLPRRPLLAGREGLRLSLAGAQTKLPAVLVDDRVALPAPGQPTTHILKPAIARFPHTTENEALVMTLAAAVGLPVTPVTARSVESRPYLLVSRYDRRFDASGQTHRLHQDDFCQALGIVPERKYAAEGGPTFKSGFDLLRRATTIPAVAVLAFVDAAIFNLIVGNADAHGKNFSLLYQGADMSLAPFYDLLSTVAYSDLSPKLAMKIAKRATIEEIGPTTWPAFSDDIGMPVRFVRRRVVELAEAVPDKPNLDLNRTEFIEGPLRREDGTHGTPSKHSPEVRDRAFGWSLTTPPSIRWDRVNKREGAAHSTAGRRAPAWSGDGQPAQFRHGRIRGAPLPCRFARARPITRATRH